MKYAMLQVKTLMYFFGGRMNKLKLIDWIKHYGYKLAQNESAIDRCLQVERAAAYNGGREHAMRMAMSQFTDELAILVEERVKALIARQNEE